MYKIKARTCTPARAVADDKVGVDQLDLEVRLEPAVGVAREYNAMAISLGDVRDSNRGSGAQLSHASPTHTSTTGTS